MSEATALAAKFGAPSDLYTLTTRSSGVDPTVIQEVSCRAPNFSKQNCLPATSTNLLHRATHSPLFPQPIFGQGTTESRIHCLNWVWELKSGPARDRSAHF
jgi:hypothetical protein